MDETVHTAAISWQYGLTLVKGCNTYIQNLNTVQRCQALYPPNF